MRNPAPARWRDTSVVAVWLVALEIENATLGVRHGSVALGALLVGAMALAAFWRRRAPLAFVAVVLALGSVLVWLWNSNNAAGNATVTPVYVLVFVPYAAARESSHRAAIVALAAVLIGGVGVNVATATPSAASYIGTAAATAAAWAAGRWLRARGLLNDELARDAERIEAERESRVRLAVADERTRIARELHALVAANVSAMVIQAEAAELLLEGDLITADRAMAAVEQTGRNALSDIRRVLGVLRHADDSPSLAPQPGVGQIYALVEAARATGQSIELIVEGEPGPLAASVDLGVYRMLEEALSDGGQDRARVKLRFTDNDIELEVTTSGANGSPPWPTLAMRERAAICHGAMHSAQLPDGRQLNVSLPRNFEEALA